ncbi:MAG: GatB/YqeY domain-containing protein [Micavibrio sp.]
MDKRTEFMDAMKNAMKARDELTTNTVRMIIAKLKERDIESRGTGGPEKVSDTEIMSMMQGMIKQRQESLTIYKNAGRDQLAEREAAEIKVIEGFLPQQMGDDEIKKIVDGLMVELNATDVRDMGKLMAEMKKRYAGQLDMAKASAMVKQKMAG